MPESSVRWIWADPICNLLSAVWAIPASVPIQRFNKTTMKEMIEAVTPSINLKVFAKFGVLGHFCESKTQEKPLVLEGFDKTPLIKNEHEKKD